MVATRSSIRTRGGTSTGPWAALNAAAISRAISTCCFWSRPTGTTSAPSTRMSAAISSG
jgi:hypothetical protein